MPRIPRAVFAGHPLHLIQRGNNRAPTFVDAHDYMRYRNVLREASARAGCEIHAYALMTNHVHLLVTPDHERGPAYMMQSVGRRYVRYFNDRFQRTGTLWEGRYRSTLIDSDRYFFACSRYVELNPVRAGMVPHPGAYRWSSFRCNADGEPDDLVTPHRLYRELGVEAVHREAAYRGMFAAEADVGAVDSIRRATNSGHVLGSARFRQDLETKAQRPLRWMTHGGDRRSKLSPPQPISTTLTPGDQAMRVPGATSESGLSKTTSPGAGQAPSTSTSDMNGPIWRGGKLTTPTTSFPTRSSGL